MIVTLKNVNKKFKRHAVLQGVDLSIEASQIVGIAGHNGSGKSTLLRIICGLLPVDQGEVHVLGERITPKTRLPEGISALFEPPGLLPDLTGIQNLKVVASIRNIMDEKSLEALLHRVGLQADDQRKVSQYSQGMKKRLGIAITMMENPKLVLMDEPLNGLDPDGIVEFRKWVRTFRENDASVLIISHVIEEMKAVCDVMYKLENGSLHAMQVG
nr:ABC transporter ATP-binding protein [Bacilli bacterium]